MRAEDLKGWLAAAKRDGTERDKRVKDGGVREEDATPTEAEGHWDRVFRWDEMIRSQQINFMPDNIYQEFLICSYKMGMEDAQWTSS